jgi:hypothetical protein
VYEADVVHFLVRDNVDRDENIQQINGVQFNALPPENPGAFAATNIGLNQYYNQADPVPGLRGMSFDGAGNIPLYASYNQGAKTISELQNKVYMGNVAEIYAVAAEDVISIDYDIRRNNAAPGAAVPPPVTTLVGYGSLLMSFTVCILASERESRKLGVGLNQYKRWFPKYAGVVSELAPNTGAMTHAESYIRSQNNRFPPTVQDRGREILNRVSAKRGTQRLRNLSRRIGFTSQPVLIADSSVVVGQQRIPNFSTSTVGEDDTVLFPFVAGPPGPNAPPALGPRHLGGEIDYDSYVALYKSSQSNPAGLDVESDFIPLDKLIASIPKVLNAENGLTIDPNIQRICPDGRGRGSVMCM